jgi:hypothetical protein
VEVIGQVVLIVCILPAVWYVSIAIHEGAHALVAVAMGLRVTGVRIAIKSPRTLVVPAGRVLPARMAAMLIAGPMANAGCAVALWWPTAQPQPRPVGVILSLAAVIPAAMAIRSLIPARSKAFRPTDGYLLLRWIFRPRLTTAQRSADKSQLATIIATTTDPLVLLSAVKRRDGLDPTGYPAFIADAERLLAVARDKRSDRATAGAIAEWLSLRFGFAYLHATIVAGQPVDRADREEIIETAELAVGLEPESKPARIGLALARLLDDRPAEALELLSDFPSSTPAQHNVAMWLFAVALVYSGDRGRADALLASVAEPADTPALRREILAKLRSATELPPLRRLDFEPGVPASADRSSST